MPSGEGGGGYDALHDHEGERIGMLPRQALEGDGHLGERQVVIARLDLCVRRAALATCTVQHTTFITQHTTCRTLGRPARKEDRATPPLTSEMSAAPVPNLVRLYTGECEAELCGGARRRR